VGRASGDAAFRYRRRVASGGLRGRELGLAVMAPWGLVDSTAGTCIGTLGTPFNGSAGFVDRGPPDFVGA
jgi:hypothetical protein